MSDLDTTTSFLQSAETAIPDLNSPPAEQAPSFLDRISQQLDYVDFEDRPAKETETAALDGEDSSESEKAVSKATPVEDIDEANLSLDDKAKAKWGELRKELKQAKARLSELERSSTETSAQRAEDPRYTEQFDQYQQQIAEYEQQLAVAKVESSREYRELVIAPMDSIISSTESIAQAFGIELDALVDAVTDSDPKKQSSKLAELVDILPERDRQRIYRMADDVLMIYEQDAQLREAASEAAKELEFREKQTQEMTKAEYRSALKKATEKTWDVFKERLAPVLEGVQVDSLLKDAMNADLDSADVELKSYSASAGVLLPHLVEKLSKKNAEIEELKKTLKSYQKSTPKVAASGTGTAAPASTSGGFLEGVMSRLGR